MRGRKKLLRRIRQLAAEVQNFYYLKNQIKALRKYFAALIDVKKGEKMTAELKELKEEREKLLGERKKTQEQIDHLKSLERASERFYI